MKMKRRAVLLLTLMTMALVAVASPAWADTFTVNSIGDDGDENPGDGRCFTGIFYFNLGAECTLRAAIQEANKNNNDPTVDKIRFDIPSTGVATISPASQLDLITEPVAINGYSQPGSSPNTATTGTNAVLKIELDGTNAGGSSGLVFGVGVSNSVIKGLAINDFANTGIDFVGSTGHRVEGNFIGTDPGGTSAEGNEVGVHVGTTDGSTIGGTTPAARNLISGNDFWGVWLEGGSSDNKIQGNLIGIDRNRGSLGNGDDGVLLSSSGNGNRILSNSIYANGGGVGSDSGLGIDLGSAGVTHNDGDDPATPEPDPDKDTGPNRLQNFPVITSATRNLDNSAGIAAKLTSTPNKTFTIQFFSGRPEKDLFFPGCSWFGKAGEGKTFLGETQVTTNRKGNASFTFASDSGTVFKGDAITATATSNSTGDTSEFSLCKLVQEPVIDPGP